MLDFNIELLGFQSSVYNFENYDINQIKYTLINTCRHIAITTSTLMLFKYVIIYS